MASLEALTPNTYVKGLHPAGPALVLSVRWHGNVALEVTYRDAEGRPHSELLFRDREAQLEVVASGQPWSFDADGALFRLASEAHRIRLAHLFDPWMAVHLAQIEPLPHQITAVYGEMLPRQPLRFLLADDPGAGKTIMAGLLIKELMLRGDLQRCLIVAPGSLVEQWQDELSQRFQLDFEILTNDRIAAAPNGNPFESMPLVIARLDKLSRDETLRPKLEAMDWDLVIVDEAHKMSASVFGGEVRYTKRYHLGRLLADRTRHLLLLSATPHNGKEEDFQLFMALLDADRFEGRYRPGVHESDASDLMRRLTKEKLRRFDGTPLFPERRAYTVNYSLSELEAALYEQVTSYVRDEFNRADALDNEQRRGTVGFALTALQRRLASSPEAIYQSLRRRRERLESRLREERLLARGAAASAALALLPALDEELLEDIEELEDDLEALPEAQVLDSASAARTIAELEVEISRLKELEALADRVRRSGQDRKWRELSHLLQDDAHMFESADKSARRKLVIFTEHRDTLNYLAGKIRALLGRPEAVVTIHGGMDRESRREAQRRFTQDKDALILIATDAAGEGINLQRAHLMVNYDLPWNPTRLEQRFGRIHRIGQTEVCHLWNLVAEETREGEVYARLLHKINRQREALGDRVFDVLGQVLNEISLRQLLIEAIRYGDRPDVRTRLFQAVDNAADRERVLRLLNQHALAHDTLDLAQVLRVREAFERAQARRLQPHFVASFFKAAFEHLGGSVYTRETLRFEITHVPSVVRQRAAQLGRAVAPRYERVTFHKQAIQPVGQPTAEFLCPGHPLMDAVIDLVLERHRPLLRQGAVLVDPNDDCDSVRVLFYLEHALQTQHAVARSERRTVSQRLLFVEVAPDATGSVQVRNAGPAPFLDYHPLPETDRPLIAPVLCQPWLQADLEAQVVDFAVANLVPAHLSEVQQERDRLIQRTLNAVRERLIKEIAYWDHRAEELHLQEQAGRRNARLNSEMARRRAEELQMRLRQRTEALALERQLVPHPPRVIGGALIVAQGLLRRLRGEPPQPEAEQFARQRAAVERAAMDAVLAYERALGNQPTDVSDQNLGWDVESRTLDGRLRFIEVKGRLAGADTVTVTRNEILAGLNKPDSYWLAVVEVRFESDQASAGEPAYILCPFRREPDFAATSVTYNWREWL